VIGADVKATAARCESTAVGAVWVASKSAGLKGTNDCKPRNIAPTEIAVGIALSADRVITSGRPMSCGKQRVNAPRELPG